MNKLEIKTDHIENNLLIKLLEEHHQEMLSHSPQESVHALDLSKLQSDNITFWTAWVDDKLAGCGALKILNNHDAEIKSMRTVKQYLRMGVAAKMLSYILNFATLNKIKVLYLETGSSQAFKPAHKLYYSLGFEECQPFADYIKDPYSLFMRKEISL